MADVRVEITRIGDLVTGGTRESERHDHIHAHGSSERTRRVRPQRGEELVVRLEVERREDVELRNARQGELVRNAEAGLVHGQDLVRVLSLEVGDQRRAGP